VIPDEAVEAAARAMAPAVWGPQVWTFVAHGETPTSARERAQRQALEDARKALEAAAPHLAQVTAWLINEHRVSWDEQGDGSCRKCGPLSGALESWEHQARILIGAT
jgi:hypothetical protein